MCSGGGQKVVYSWSNQEVACQPQASTDMWVRTQYLTTQVIHVSLNSMTNSTNIDQVNLFLYCYPDQPFYFVQP